MTKARKPKKAKRNRTKEILFTLSGDVREWLEKIASERGLLDKRGGLQSLIQEKLFAQMRAELPSLASTASE